MSRSKITAIAVACTVVAVSIAIAVTLTGCGAGTPAATQLSGITSAVASATVTSSSDVQACGECGGLGAPKETTGTAMAQGGVQVVSIAITGGYYVPNRITAKAGTPIKVVFTGNAKGCVPKPDFASLGRSGDVTGTGSATVDLGTLAPGTYDFTCAMGANKGTLTVR